MTVTSGFFNSLAGDRKYDALQMSNLFEGIITDGILSAIGNAFIVAPGTGLTVTIGTGRAWFNKTWINNDSSLIVSITNPDMILPRIDTVVIEVDSSDAVRATVLKIIIGTPGSIPVAPTLTNAGFVHQYPLADIAVAVGATSFIGANITNRRGTADCPFAAGAILGVTTDSLLTQWNSEFDVWFDEMKDQLSTDAAGNLQNQIDALDSRIDDADTKIDALGNLYTKISGIWHKQLWIGGFKPTNTSGCGLALEVEMPTNKNIVACLPFDPSTIEYAYADVPLAQDYNGGVIYFKPYWLHPATTTNFKVSWGLCGVVTDNAGAIDVPFGTPVYVNDIGGNTNYYYIGDMSSGMTISGTPTAGKMLQLKASRMATDAVNDTLATDAYLRGFLVFYPVG